MKRIHITESNQLKLGVILSYTQTAAGIIISLLYTPIMLRILGKNEYGLYSTVSATIATLGILDFGFVSAYIKYYTKYKLNNDFNKINKLNGMFLTVYFVIGIVSFVCGMFLSKNLGLIFGNGLTLTEKNKAEIMMVILSINMFISFFSTAYKSYINAHEKFVVMKLVGLLQTVFNPLIRLPIIILGYGSVGMTVVSFIINVVVTLIFIWYSIKKLKFKASFGHWEKGLFKSMFCFSGLIALNMIVDQINGRLDNVIIARFCGTAEVAVYAIGASLCTYFSNFSSQISSVFVPRVHRMVNKTKENPVLQREELTKFFTKVGRLQFLVLALIASGLVFFGKSFILLWAGKGYEASYWVVMMRVLPAIIPLIQNTGIEIQRAQSKHYYRSCILFAAALLNLGLTIYLCQVWTSIGAAVGTGLSTLIANGIIMNIVYHKKININVITFWKNIFNQLCGMIIPFIVGTLIMTFANTTTFAMLIMWIIVYVIVYCIFVWTFSMNQSEKSIATSIYKRIFKKNKSLKVG